MIQTESHAKQNYLRCSSTLSFKNTESKQAQKNPGEVLMMESQLETTMQSQGSDDGMVVVQQIEEEEED